MNPSGCGVTPSASHLVLPHIHKNVGGENNFLNHISSEPFSPLLSSTHKKVTKVTTKVTKFLLPLIGGFVHK